MEFKIKDIPIGEIDKAAKILLATFAEDKGMKALFTKGDPEYEQKLFNWFRATLKMQIRNKQLVWGAYSQNELIGLALTSHTSFKPSGLSMLKWTYSVLYNCGFKTVKRTVLHDLERRKHFTRKEQFILEFIGVSPQYQGKGVGKRLLEKLKKHAREQGQNVWLETTRPVNIKIFEKQGFKLIHTEKEGEVVYYRMENGG